MSLVLETNYSKKLGLPGYSSHQYSVTVRTEVTDRAQVEAESSRLYELLQACVDRDLQKTGYLPAPPTPAAAAPNGHARPPGDAWERSPAQRGLILDLVAEHQLDKQAVESLALERFGHSVKQLNKLKASGLIDELIETHGKARPPAQGGSASRRPASLSNRRAVRNGSAPTGGRSW